MYLDLEVVTYLANDLYLHSILLKYLKQTQIILSVFGTIIINKTATTYVRIINLVNTFTSTSIRFLIPTLACVYYLPE